MIETTGDNGRIVVLDSLRGWALWGVLAVNLIFFSSGRSVSVAPNDPTGQVGFFLIHWLFAGKAYGIFALLFGVGVGLQMRRLPENRADLFFVRRFGILAMMGMIHAVLLSQGDILVVYAAFGVMLAALRGLPARVLVGLGIGLLAVPVVVNGVIAVQLMTEPVIDGVGTQSLIIDREIWRDGSLLEIINARIQAALGLMIAQFTVGMPNIFGLFLIGLGWVKSGGMRRLFQSQAALGRLMVIGLGVGLPVNAIYALIYTTVQPPDVRHNIAAIAHTIGAPVMVAGMVGLMGWMMLCGGWRERVVRWFAPAGRMTLTHYVGQSIVANLLFYSYGLRWYGLTNDLHNLILATVIFGGQVVVSVLYLRRFEQGPLEWLWRRGQGKR